MRDFIIDANVLMSIIISGKTINRKISLKEHKKRTQGSQKGITFFNIQAYKPIFLTRNYKNDGSIFWRSVKQSFCCCNP